jgi:hypothetical protein
MNTVTTLVFLSPWAVFFVWESVILYKRMKHRPLPKTISMVARDLRYHTTSVIYMWGGMASHWWWPSAEFAPVWAGVTFWCMGIALLIADILTARSHWGWWPDYLKTLKHPLLWLAVGFLSGKLLFPQA